MRLESDFCSSLRIKRQKLKRAEFLELELWMAFWLDANGEAGETVD